MLNGMLRRRIRQLRHRARLERERRRVAEMENDLLREQLDAMRDTIQTLQTAANATGLEAAAHAAALRNLRERGA